MYEVVPRFDVLFELHPKEHLQKFFTRKHNKNHYEELKRIGSEYKIWMQKADENIKYSSSYPLQDMIDKFGDYFTNSVSYMLALAIDKGAEEIHLYGVDMSVGGEYETQRASCEYFIGLARGLGIKVIVSENSDLLKTNYLYGYEDNKKDRFMEKCRRRLKFLETQKKQTEKQIQDLQILLNRTEGSIEDLKYTMTIIIFMRLMK